MYHVFLGLERALNQLVLDPVSGGSGQDSASPATFYGKMPDEFPFLSFEIGSRLCVDLVFSENKWIASIIRVNKNGSYSQRVEDKNLELRMPGDSRNDVGVVLREFLKALLEFENFEPWSQFLSDTAEWRHIRQVAVKEISAKKYSESQREKSVRLNSVRKRDNRKVYAWIAFAAFLLWLMGLNAGSSNQKDCNYIADPRGGYCD
jgi:hypothetical protein